MLKAAHGGTVQLGMRLGRQAGNGLSATGGAPKLRPDKEAT
jgi:hypothetical protein